MLQEKASIQDILAKSEIRARNNYALAAKLAQKIGEMGLQVSKQSTMNKNDAPISLLAVDSICCTRSLCSTRHTPRCVCSLQGLVWLRWLGSCSEALLPPVVLRQQPLLVPAVVRAQQMTQMFHLKTGTSLSQSDQPCTARGSHDGT